MQDWIKTHTRFVVITNNTCSFSCWKCNHHQDKPLGAIPYRLRPWEISLTDLTRFTELLDPILKEVRLTGGETTLLNPEKLSTIIKHLHQEKIITGLLTNGYGIKNMSPSQLEGLDYAILDNHGFNHDHILWCQKYLEAIGIDTKIVNRIIHYDIDQAAAAPHDGKTRCSLWLRIPALYQDIITPCCNFMVVDGGPTMALQDLRQAGWSLENDNLLETIKEPGTIPQSVHEVCLERCYAQNLEKADYRQLTWEGPVTV